MRAVARGFTLKALPQCPERCGGAGVDPSTLDEATRRHRRKFGCDEPIPEGERCYYAIRCPRCDGRAANGAECDLCKGEAPGSLVMRRCPASHFDREIEALLIAIGDRSIGVLPHPGGSGDQALAFNIARTVFERERDEAIEEQREAGD